MFRLVWSDDQFETRRGFVKHYVGNVYIGEVETMGEFPKYNWIKSRWLFEQWYPGDLVYTPDVPGTMSGSFECLYVFEDSKGKALPLNLTVIQLIVHRILGPSSSPDAIASRLKLEEEIKEAKIDAYVEDAIDTSPMASLLHHGEAGQISKEHWIDSPNLRNKQ
jgi:hypothetical protein